MPNDTHWHSLIGVAEHLHEQARKEKGNLRAQEAYLRSAVSRAYYAAFNLARQSWEAENGALEGEQIHRKLIDSLKNSGEQRHKSASMLLNGIRKNRVDADYREGASVTDQNVQAVIARARNVIKHMNR